MFRMEDNRNQLSLYERLGGETFVPIFVESFFDEFVDDTRMDQFFNQVSISCLKLHQIKFYRLMFGPEHLRPDYADLVDYMLLTHSRLFQLGMNEEHFDMIATGFVRGLQVRMVEQDLIDEAVAILAPLRGLFEYGAKLARKKEESTSGVVANHRTAEEGNLDVVLADHTMGLGEPYCLKEVIARTKPNVKPAALREWVYELAELFGVDNDIHVAEYFMSMPFMDQYPYIVYFMKLAFSDLSPDETEELVSKIKYPRGANNPALPQRHFVSMIDYLVEVCHEKGLKQEMIEHAKKRLIACRRSFPKKVEVVDGINAPHFLQKAHTETDIQQTPEKDSECELNREQALEFAAINSDPKKPSTFSTKELPDKASSRKKPKKTKKFSWFQRVLKVRKSPRDCGCASQNSP